MSPAQYATTIPHPTAVLVSEPFNENENQRLNMEIAVLNERREMAETKTLFSSMNYKLRI